MGDLDRESSLEDFSENNSISQDPDEDVAAGAPIGKTKRRTKNDHCERGFKCGCGKDYLSYPALYTHIKQKHGGSQPNGTDAPLSRGTRGRGRPRKQGFPVVQSARAVEEDLFLKQEQLYGGPTDPVAEYPGEDQTEDRIYSTIQRLKTDASSVSQEVPVCDEVFALYLIDLATKVSTDGYRLFVSFAQALRQCLNQKGWDLQDEAKNRVDGGVFCEMQHAQNLPEVSNFFITEFIEKNFPALDRKKAIAMMLHFNEWLFAHRYSNLKLSLITSE